VAYPRLGRNARTSKGKNQGQSYTEAEMTLSDLEKTQGRKGDQKKRRGALFCVERGIWEGDNEVVLTCGKKRGVGKSTGKKRSKKEGKFIAKG